MLLKKQKKINIDTFLTQRGINLSNYKLGDSSVFLGRVLKAKKNKKNLKNKFPFSTVRNSPIKNLLFNSLVSNNNDSKIYNNNNKSKQFIYKKSCFLNSHIKSKSSITNDINDSKSIFDYEEKKAINPSKGFNTNKKLNKNNFSSFMKNMNHSTEILNRFNRNKNTELIKTNEKKINYLDILFTPNPRKKPIIIKNNKKINEIIYSKKNKNDINDKFKFNLTNTNISRNKKSRFFTQNNSKSKSKNKTNSISHSIDFSIINKINLKDNFNNAILSKTSDNFFILNEKKKSNTNSSQTRIFNHNINSSKNILFLTHFIKYCYLYFIQIIKNFFNNLKKIKDEKMKIINKYNKNKNNRKNNLFDEFNKDDFDKETIKNRTSDNFFDANGYNDKSFSFISESGNNIIYNRIKRINNQNCQEKNLLQIINTAKIENYNNKKIVVSKKNCFDNENVKENEKKDDNVHSPFFMRNIQTTKDKFPLESESGKIILTKNEMKEKSRFCNDNVSGFFQINEDINQFNNKETNINFLDKDIKTKISLNNIFLQENQNLSQDEILSFRKKTENNINNSINIIAINSIVTSDHRINIDIKYINDNNFSSSAYLHNNIDINLQIDKFFFEYILNKKKLKKISIRLIDAKFVKEKEEIVHRNKDYFLNNLSTIKEEESPMTKTVQKNENYYPLSNNSKLFSKISVEKIIDGQKRINEEDIDKILMNSLSDYNNNYYKQKKLKKWQSQEIMVVSNFNSAMRNRRNRKENAKLLIEGILCLIKFFGVLCFKIRKECFIKIKWNWKIKRFVNYLINFYTKKNN